MLVGTREGTRVRENVRECGQTGLDKGDTWPDLKAHSGTRWKQNSRCGSPVAWGNPLSPPYSDGWARPPGRQPRRPQSPLESCSLRQPHPSRDNPS